MQKLPILDCKHFDCLTQLRPAMCALTLVVLAALLPPLLLADERAKTFPESIRQLNHNPMELAVQGERYQAQVPDTLDLADRMGLAVNALTNVWDPEREYGMKFVVDFSRKPPVLYVNHITDLYLNIPPKFVEALALTRLASGTDLNIATDLGVLKSQLKFIGDDGLTYAPVEMIKQVPQGLGQFEETPGGPAVSWSEIWGEGRQLVALSILAQIDDDPRWIEIGKRKVDRLLELTRTKKVADLTNIEFASKPPGDGDFESVRQKTQSAEKSEDLAEKFLIDEFRFLWRATYTPGIEVPANADEPGLMNSEGGGLYSKDDLMTIVYSIGSTGHGAGLFYRITGYEPALELSRGLAHWALARLFYNEDGSYSFWHYHHGLYALMAVCEYGIASGDRALLERVDACYRFVREMGDPLIGYFPEAQPGSDWYLQRQGNTVEICEVADMCWLALNLTKMGVGEYWDDVDRWVRNVYAQGQICDTGLFDSIPDAYYRTGPDPRPYRDTHNIKERSLGSFFGWMRANEGLEVQQTPQGPKLKEQSVQHCCTANGARTLYCIWDSIVQQQGDLVRVNLLLNRASPWLDVASYLPVKGQVDLHIKDTAKVAVRVPRWVNPENVQVTVNDESVRAKSEGRYLHVYLLQPGDQVRFTFDVPQKTFHRVLGEMPYRLTMRGNTVIDISPKGEAYPLYQNPPTGRLVEKGRFVPQIQNLQW